MVRVHARSGTGSDLADANRQATSNKQHPNGEQFFEDLLRRYTGFPTS